MHRGYEDSGEPQAKIRPRRDPEVVKARLLREGLAPIHRQIAKLQPRSVWILMRVNGKNPNAPSIRQDAEELIEAVAKERWRFSTWYKTFLVLPRVRRFWMRRTALERVETDMRGVVTNITAN